MVYRLVVGMSRGAKHWIFVTLDAVCAFLAVYLAGSLFASVPGITGFGGLDLLPLALGSGVFAMAASWGLGLPRIRLNAYDVNAVALTAWFGGVVACAAFLFNSVGGEHLPAGAFLIVGMTLTVLAVFSRWLLLLITLAIYRHGDSKRMRLMIYGAGKTGQQLATALRHDRSVDLVAFIDDNPTVQGLRVAGMRVYAPTAVSKLVSQKKVDRIVLAMPSLTTPAQARLKHKLQDAGCAVHALPSFAALVGKETLQQGTDLPIDILLGRNRLDTELPGVNHAYAGRRILVTGAGGSIGSELCRQLLACRPAVIILLDHSEAALYEIESELRAMASETRIVAVLGSVMNRALVHRVLQRNAIDVVLHAAAYKHLPLVEENVLAGLENNVCGTRVVAEAARDHRVARFILISSDKAVRPTNVMGASKRLAELVVQDIAVRSSQTRFSMVRFGNVLGSSGSVVPRFQKQIERGGPVTLTHPDVTRYFMTISEASRLVLLAGSFAKGGEVFVLNMGKPVRIADLARQMIESAGYTVRDARHPNGDIEIRVVGLRRGEKLHEELLISGNLAPTPHEKILCARESGLSQFEIVSALKRLRHAIDTGDEAEARAVIARWIEHAAPGEALPARAAMHSEVTEGLMKPLNPV